MVKTELKILKFAKNKIQENVQYAASDAVRFLKKNVNSKMVAEIAPTFNKVGSLYSTS